MIIEAATDHEICSHTYSHALAEEFSRDILKHDLGMARRLHEEHGLPDPTSIIMPRHQEVDYSLLADHGFRTIRRPIEGYGVEKGGLRKMWWLLTRDHPACSIEKVDGIVGTTCTPHPSLTSTVLRNGQRELAWFYRAIPQRVRELLHRRYLKCALGRAIDDDTHVHLWTHLYNSANETQWRGIEWALEFLVQARDEGSIELKPMRALPEGIK